MQPLVARNRIALLGLSVGLVLADSSVVTLALPKILVQFDVEVGTLAWALISFNLALALAAVPAAALARRRPVGVFGVSTVVFAAASLACAFSPTFGVLVGLRAIQGVAGPAIGGILTQLFGWEPIFVLQAPVALAGLLALRGVQARPVPEPAERPQIAANAALLLVSGALVAALFILVILLINGWRLEPLTAGLVVTIMPLAAISATRFAGHLSPLWTRAASGAILISGGLAALAWLPHASVIWTVPPQIFIGAGLGLALSALTQRALAGRSGQAVHGGWTIAARHAGIVLGLLLLTPIFTSDLNRNEHDALAAGTAAVLDSRISPLDKIGVARDVLVAVDRATAEGRIPDVRAVVDHRDDSAYADLGNALQDQLDRAVTNAFSRSFLVSALLGLLALVPIVLGRREVGV